MGGTVSVVVSEPGRGAWRRRGWTSSGKIRLEVCVCELCVCVRMCVCEWVIDRLTSGGYNDFFFVMLREFFWNLSCNFPPPVVQGLNSSINPLNASSDV